MSWRKKKKEYPKTYEECVKILGFTTVYTPKVEPMFDYDDDIIALQKLKHCRDAYWKIAGEEMELGKPWDPDWEFDDTKYVIFFNKNELVVDMVKHTSHAFAFPTEESVNEFVKNFGNDLDVCKEIV